MRRGKEDTKPINIPPERAVRVVAFLLLVAVPYALDDYYIAQLAFVFIYAIAGIGMVLLLGRSGQISVGHAAFLALGAYSEALLQSFGVPFLISLPIAGLVAGLMGGFAGFLFSRFFGPYLAMATIAFAFIVNEGIVRWESITNGNAGIRLDALAIFSLPIATEGQFYYLTLGVLLAVFAMATRIRGSIVGKTIASVRDDEVAAESIGVNVILHRALAFGFSAMFVGLAGGLYAHKMLYIGPDAFGFGASLELLALAVVGGSTSSYGAILGAAFVVCLPQVLSLLGDYAPYVTADKAALQGVLYGVGLVLVMVFEPQGLYGLYFKAKQFVIAMISMKTRAV